MTESDLSALISGIVPVVREHLTKALSDIGQRLAAAEARITGLAQFEQTLSGMRDRVVAIETKSASQPEIGTELRQRLEAVEHREMPTVDQAPILERLSALEARISVLGDVRDRVVMMETKAAAAPTPVAEHQLESVRVQLLSEIASQGTTFATSDAIDRRLASAERAHISFDERLEAIERKEMPSIDQTPVLERLSALEARLSTIGDLRDKVITLETKSAMPIPSVDLSVIHALETGIGQLQEKFASLETKVAAPDPHRAEITKTAASVGELTKDLGALRDRLATVELKGAIPGPQGPPGKDGRDGRDGLDGMTLEHVTGEMEDDRIWVMRAGVGGGQVKEIARVTGEWMLYRDVWKAGQPYERGDVVTRGGSMWHCNVTGTSAMPGDGSKDWTLAVKCGRDGKDFREPPPSAVMPVVRVGGGAGNPSSSTSGSGGGAAV
jgi:hypothetical protein